MIKYYDEVEADFQQYYNLDVARVEPRRRARLIFQLPHDCRLFTKIQPANKWTDEKMLLVQIMNSLNFIEWTKTDNARKHPRKPPEPFMPPEIKKARQEAEKAKRQAKQQLQPMPIDEIKRLLAKPRV